MGDTVADQGLNAGMQAAACREDRRGNPHKADPISGVCKRVHLRHDRGRGSAGKPKITYDQNIDFQIFAPKLHCHVTKGHFAPHPQPPEAIALIRRLKNAVAAGRRAAAAASPARNPARQFRGARVHWALVHIDDEIGPGEQIAQHVGFCQEANYGCLVISNRFDPALLSEESVTFEFAPLDVRAARDTGQDARLATRYLLDRLSHTVSFWNVVGCTWTGNRSRELRRAAGASAPRLAAMSRHP